MVGGVVDGVGSVVESDISGVVGGGVWGCVGGRGELNVEKGGEEE